MSSFIKSVGAYYPVGSKNNTAFIQNEFLNKEGVKINKASELIIDKFQQITEIQERRIAERHISSSEMGYLAAAEALKNGATDKESIDYIIVAHNWGNVSADHNYYDAVPNLAARVKGRLGIRNPNCIAYDILFGCPGWLEAMKQGHLFIQSGLAKRVLVVATDTVSRVIDECDIDSMLFSDGAGAVVLEKTEEQKGILAHKTVSHCNEELDYLKMDCSYDKDLKDTGLYLKMEGKKVFKYGMEQVPAVINSCLEELDLKITDIKYFLMHQANGKMIKLIGKRLFDMHNIATFDEAVLPMNVSTMGNNSVATIPTLLHELTNKKINDRGIQKGDIVAFASVGAGMHANCVIHQF